MRNFNKKVNYSYFTSLRANFSLTDNYFSNIQNCILYNIGPQINTLLQFHLTSPIILFILYYYFHNKFLCDIKKKVIYCIVKCFFFDYTLFFS